MKYICCLIAVEDMDVSRRFYEEVLGQDIRQDMGENVLFEGGFAIHLKSHFQNLLDGKAVQPGGDGYELYFEEDDLDSIVKSLREYGVEFVHEIREQPWKQQVVRFHDPDGHLIEIGESMEHVAYRLSLEGRNIAEISRITYLSCPAVARAISVFRGE